MKKWTTPITEVQDFVANEYVAACWGVGCEVDGVRKYYPFEYHDKDDCGNAAHQAVRQLADGSYGFVELKNGRQLPCKIYLNDSFTNGVNSLTEAQIESLNGKTIYWTTQYGITYYHHGEIHLTDEGRTSKHS